MRHWATACCSAGEGTLSCLPKQLVRLACRAPEAFAAAESAQQPRTPSYSILQSFWVQAFDITLHTPLLASRVWDAQGQALRKQG